MTYRDPPLEPPQCPICEQSTTADSEWGWTCDPCREHNRTGPPLVNTQAWRSRVRAEIERDLGPALEAEAARDADATPEQLWRRATGTTSTPTPGRPRARDTHPGCAGCDHGYQFLPNGTVTPCPNCLPAQAALTTPTT